MRILDARLITIRRGNIITFDRDTTTNEQVLRNHLFREQIPFNQLHKNCSFVPRENGTLQEHPLLSMVPRRNPIPKESAPLCLSNETRSTDDGGSVVYRVIRHARIARNEGFSRGGDAGHGRPRGGQQRKPHND